jgi:sugar phosphate isomerase/epimerase
MNRRDFNKTMAGAAAGMAVLPGSFSVINLGQEKMIRLGAPLFEKYSNPDEWVKAIKRLGYTAAYCPVQPGEKTDVIKLYEQAALKADIRISEVGAWCNPLDPDETKARAAIEKCIRSLELAEIIGAGCCVNISGSRNSDHWAGPHKDNLTKATFDQIVEITRKIIDSVHPKRTFFTLETMPWSYPDSVDSYLELIKAIDRKEFAVHFDPVNLINTPEKYFHNGEVIKDAFKRLGKWIKNCHAKDIRINEEIYSVRFDEVRPGLGLLDYGVFLVELAKLEQVPMMLEHLETEAEYSLAASYVRSVGTKKVQTKET